MDLLPVFTFFLPRDVCIISGDNIPTWFDVTHFDALVFYQCETTQTNPNQRKMPQVYNFFNWYKPEQTNYSCTKRPKYAIGTNANNNNNSHRMHLVQSGGTESELQGHHESTAFLLSLFVLAGVTPSVGRLFSSGCLSTEKASMWCKRYPFTWMNICKYTARLTHVSGKKCHTWYTAPLCVLVLVSQLREWRTRSEDGQIWMS